MSMAPISKVSLTFERGVRVHVAYATIGRHPRLTIAILEGSRIDRNARANVLETHGCLWLVCDLDHRLPEAVMIISSHHGNGRVVLEAREAFRDHWVWGPCGWYGTLHAPQK
jgi:hypothetical protein